MTDRITVTGVVGSDPRPTMTPAGLQITNFRLASTRRYFDRATGQWTDGETNWYSVSTFRQLALNTAASIRKGEHVVVHGRLRVRQWKTAEKSGLAIEIEADSVGHDLAWGTSSYTKSSASRASASTDEPEYGESTNVGAASDVWATPGTGWGVTEPGSDDVAVLDSDDQPADDEVVEHVPA